MLSKWKHNLGWKVASVIFAVFLWWTVVNIDDPVTSSNFRVPVTVTNAEVVTNQGKSYQIINDTENVVVTVSARRKVLNEIDASDIVATADMREVIANSLIPVRITIHGFEGQYEEASTNPSNIQVQIEDTEKKTFPITTVSTGTPRDGYVVGGMSVSPQKVDVSGPTSTIQKISKVVAKVDVTELSADTSMDTSLIFYDAADNIIDQTRLSSNVEQNGVTVDVKIWETKNINLNFDTSRIDVADGYLLSGIEVEPQIIEVAGSHEDLTAVTELDIPGEALQTEELSKTEEIVIDVTQYLPDGIVLADQSTNSVVVRIILEEQGTKSILLPVRSVQVLNAPENMELTYGPEQEIELKFVGRQEVLDTLSSEKIIAAIDLSSYTDEGTFDIPVTITELPDECTYLGGNSIQITLKKKSE